MANISETSIRRPVLSTVMMLVVLLFGYIGYNFLGVREYPSVDQPIISVNVSYPGANAEVIMNQITEPLEQNINGIPGHTLPEQHIEPGLEPYHRRIRTFGRHGNRSQRRTRQSIPRPAQPAARLRPTNHLQSRRRCLADNADSGTQRPNARLWN